MNFNVFKKINTATVLIAILTFIIGWQLGQRTLANRQYYPLNNQKSAIATEKNIDFKLFWDTWNLVSKEYVDSKAIDSKKMYYGAIQGMVASLGDPYTVFLSPEAQKSTKEELGGSFEGVGIQLGFNKDKRLVVIAPLDGTPAQKAGVKAGDLILKIDGKDATNLSLPDAVSLIRGPKSSKVTLQIYTEGDKEPKDISIVRDTIIVKSVEFSLKTTKGDKKIALIKLSRFGERTADEWKEAISQTLSSNPSGVILDLRNNPGGYLEGAVFVGSEFIRDSNIVLQENGKGQRTDFQVNRLGFLLDIPMVVLINKGSASASEIVAGAIQDHSRGKLVGEQSFGKGTIQEAQELSENTGIHITTAKWLTPNGRWIHNIGLTPDIMVKSTDEVNKDPQLDKALELLN